MSDKIAENKVVTITYTLRSDGGEVLDSSDEASPLVYLHGAQNIVPGLEGALEGIAVGESIKTTVPPEEGYGTRVGPTQDVPRSVFPDDAEMHTGQYVVAHDDEGRQIPFFIARVTEDTVTIDPNHPLAGQTLHFEVTVVGLRDATLEEISHGHPHGPGGAH